MAAFVNSYSFSHRFSDQATSDTAGFQEIIHQCQDVTTVTALTRQFFQFAIGTGFAPCSVVDAFLALADEYGQAYCGYTEEKTMG
jgi:hypothetical protein